MKVRTAAALFAASILSASTAFSGSPMISSIPNQYIGPNSSTPLINFQLYDDVTDPSDLTITFSSSNTDLVPNSTDSIILGGSGAYRTIRVVPLAKKTGITTITLNATDSDGEIGQESFDVEVIKTLSN